MVEVPGEGGDGDGVRTGVWVAGEEEETVSVVRSSRGVDVRRERCCSSSCGRRTWS